MIKKIIFGLLVCVSLAWACFASGASHELISVTVTKVSQTTDTLKGETWITYTVAANTDQVDYRLYSMCVITKRDVIDACQNLHVPHIGRFYAAWLYERGIDFFPQEGSHREIFVIDEEHAR
jgi:hypothetical protein